MKSELSIWRLVMKNSYLTKSIIVLILILCGFISCNFDAKEKQNQNEKQKKQETVKCNVEYESTYGECPESIIVETGTVLSDSNLPSLSDDSEIVIFEGWYDSDGNKIIPEKYVVSKNITLTAKWKYCELPVENIDLAYFYYKTQNSLKLFWQDLTSQKNEYKTFDYVLVTYTIDDKDEIVIIPQRVEKGVNQITIQNLMPAIDCYYFTLFTVGEMGIISKWKTVRVDAKNNNVVTTSSFAMSIIQELSILPELPVIELHLIGYFENFSEIINVIKSKQILIDLDLLKTEGLMSIENNFFDRSSFVNITIPNTVTSIGMNAFEFSFNLRSVSIPDSVSYIGDSAFGCCGNLDNVIIPNSITSISKWMFSGCSKLSNITIPDSIITICDSAFSGCSSLTSITISDSVTTIGDSAFSGCSSLKNITIPDSVTTIGNFAFSSCSSLESITIPDSVKSIGSYVFDGCSALSSIPILPAGITSISNGMFRNCDGLWNNIIIPDGITSIGDDAFLECSYLRTITIPDSVTYIGNQAFLDCSNLKLITIPNSVTSMGDSVFSGCLNLRYVYFEDTSKEWYLLSNSNNENYIGCMSDDAQYNASLLKSCRGKFLCKARSE